MSLYSELQENIKNMRDSQLELIEELQQVQLDNAKKAIIEYVLDTFRIALGEKSHLEIPLEKEDFMGHGDIQT